MPLHDWSRIPPELFHHFRQDWSVEITRTLNRGLLPRELSALVEQRAGAKEPDVYASRANCIVIRHRLKRIVGIIEIVSPGNKNSQAALRAFIDKTIDFLRKGIHILIVDLFPPTPRDPFGIHKVIWDEIAEQDFILPDHKNRTLVSYGASEEKVAYLKPIGVGDELANMPLFLAKDLCILVPLEPTYQATWDASPEAYRYAVETGEMPDSAAE